MTLKAFSIRDSKIGAYSPPNFLHTHGEAEREFHKHANNKEGKIGQYPEDFDLFYVGDYDDQTGKFSPIDTPQHVVKAFDLIRQ